MKKLSIALLSVMAIGFATSCSDDDSNGGTSGTLEGKWIYDKTGVAAQGQEALLPYSHQEGCDKDYIEFVSGGSYKEVEYSGSECDVFTETTTWSRNGNTLTVGTGEDAMNGTIERLTGTDLRVKTTVDYEGQTQTFIATYKRG